VFKEFLDENVDLFIDAPATISGEQNLVYYSLYQKYLKLYENTLSEYIASLDISQTAFYSQLSDILNDPEIKDKKLLHFVNYLVACTDYESFYKLMGRAAKKARKDLWNERELGISTSLDQQLQSRAEGKDGENKRVSESKGGDSKHSHK
jgi:hypothetical protein